MKRHYVTRVDDSKFALPDLYRGHGEGYRRNEIVDATVSPASVHMGLGLVEIEPGGRLDPTAHAFEKGIYVLAGAVVASIDGRACRLGPDDYALIPKGAVYSYFNPAAPVEGDAAAGAPSPAQAASGVAGPGAVRLLEMMAPQPQPPGSDFVDTWFPGGEAVREAEPPDLGDPRVAARIGHFDEASVPAGGTISAVGARSSSIHGVSIKEFIDPMLGAHHLSMFLVQFQPGGAGTQHDHPHEESFFFLAGQAEAVLDGERYTVGAGDVVWTGVGCFHSFENKGDEPVRWIETQAPLPAAAQGFRFRREWDAVSGRRDGGEPSD